MIITQWYGYEERSYLDMDPYLSGGNYGNEGFQATLSIVDTLEETGFQSLQNIVDRLNETAFQTEANIEDFENALGFEVVFNTSDFLNETGFQVEGSLIDLTDAMGWEAISTNVGHALCSGYLEDSYKTGPYLLGIYCAAQGFETFGLIGEFELGTGFQAQRNIIDYLNETAFQVEMVIDAEEAFGFQANLQKSLAEAFQANVTIYNITNLRILCDFPSRGTTGTSWTSTSTAVGDFSVNNLNTDIVEEVWRSNSSTTVTLSCNTGLAQGVFLDTLAMLNHNLTTSAIVTLEGSTSATYSPIGVSIPLTVEEENMYYIAPELPNVGYRYWRLLISDATNPDGYLEIGTIVFGAATIFSGECFTDRVLKQTTHYKDQINTEGFTNVMNDRGLKTAITLEFRNLQYGGGNYNAITDIFKDARTHLKCLYIPTPEVPSRFAIFGKLSEIPAEEHNYRNSRNDHVDFTMTIDESL